MNDLDTIIQLLSKSHSVFHVVKNISDELINNGFVKLDEKDNFKLENGGKYFVTRNETSIIAFQIPEKITDLHFQITSTHNDSPSFKIKPNPIKKVFNLIQLNTEPYGGGIYNTWLDKPLSFAGRILCIKDEKITSKLIDIDEDLLIIPNVCIHNNRNINTGYNYNPSIDTLPIIGEWKEGFSFNEYLKNKADIDGEILSFDLFLYNREEPKLIGINKEFLSSPREDDLASTYSALLGFLSSKSSSFIKVFASFDNEEVGSLTKQGANSTFLKEILNRIIKTYQNNIDDYEKAIANSINLSIDNAHANHPNHPELSDKTTDIELNRGIVIKYNANQSYTSDAFSSSVVKTLCNRKQISYQEFTNRSDLRGGSTLGNISQSEVSITTVDIGIPQLAMHSSYETLGKKDVTSMIELTKEYFETEITFFGNNIEIK